MSPGSKTDHQTTVCKTPELCVRNLPYRSLPFSSLIIYWTSGKKNYCRTDYLFIVGCIESEYKRMGENICLVMLGKAPPAQQALQISIMIPVAIQGKDVEMVLSDQYVRIYLKED